ncbi:MAG: hypothetical protein VB070_04235 [Clostridiaceae bacterium]|nr:hypothetical protein [Clostridiaceae bacterium]
MTAGRVKSIILLLLALILTATACADFGSATARPETAAEPTAPTATAPTAVTTAAPPVVPTNAPTPTPTAAPEPTATAPTAVTTAAPEPTAAPTPTIAPTPVSAGNIGRRLSEYLSDQANGQSVGARAARLNGGEYHNACVYTVSEALRRIGCDIPMATSYTATLKRQLLDRGFKIHRDLQELQAGDICFTTDAEGNADGIPTHTFIFLSWAGPDTANIFDNQIYDYSSHYHTRSLSLTYLDQQPDRPKDAMAFFMRHP